MRSLLNAAWGKFALQRYIITLLVWIAFGPIIHAANVEVRSRLSETEGSVGVPVRMEIIVQGARSAEVPRDLGVDGLQTRYVGESVQIQMINFQVTSSASYTYIIVPLREGNFTIPALEVEVNGRTFRTQPLRLTVYGSGNNWGNPSGGSQGAAPPIPATPTPTPSQRTSGSAPVAQGGKPAFGLLIVPKKQIYVGEVVPVEIRYYFHPNLPVQSVNSMPSLIGDDFVVQKIPEPVQGRQEIHGVKYMVLSFRSSIRPLKAGELQLPSTSISCQVLTQTRPELPVGMGDAFFQSFLDSMPGVTRVQKLEVTSDPVALQVLALPEENKPDSFHGAIGKFSLQTKVSPSDPSPGDPVTFQATISGEGNFDQIGAPDLTSKQGWQSYPPSSKFAPSDNIGYSGKKTFDWMLVPKENKNSTPEVEFSYFDPSLHKYTTLHGRSQGVHAVPLASGAMSPVNPSPSPTATVAATTLTPPVARDRFRIARSLRSESFQPITERTPFVIVNAVALAALLAYLGIQLARCHAASDRGRKAALRRLTAACLARASVSQGKEFYASTVEYLRLQVSAATGKETRDAPAEEVVNVLGFRGKEAELVFHVFAKYDESAYGGAKTTISSETRTAVLMLLKRKK